MSLMKCLGKELGVAEFMSRDKRELEQKSAITGRR